LRLASWDILSPFSLAFFIGRGRVGGRLSRREYLAWLVMLTLPGLVLLLHYLGVIR
jgi:hypothetical protein